MKKTKSFSLIKRWLLASLGSLAVLSVLGGGLLWYWLQPVDRRSDETITVVVSRGLSTTEIGQLLVDKDLIRSPLVWQFVIWWDGLRGKLQAGSFALQRSQSTSEIAAALTKGTNDVWVTIPEGLRATEIGAIFAKDLPNFDLNSEAYQTECLAYEGYLFPETYLVPRQYSTAQACRLLRQEYGRQVTMDMRETMHRAGHTEEEVITLASIVQREAKKTADMKIVAGILWQRLSIGMALQVDATLQYARGYAEAQQTWWPIPSAADRQLDSPYNTYQQTGLPPTPIASPGIEAIRAAISPTATDYLYYISNTDGTQMYYATTYAEHQQNIARYLN